MTISDFIMGLETACAFGSAEPDTEMFVSTELDIVKIDRVDFVKDKALIVMRKNNSKLDG